MKAFFARLAKYIRRIFSRDSGSVDGPTYRMENRVKNQFGMEVSPLGESLSFNPENRWRFEKIGPNVFLENTTDRVLVLKSALLPGLKVPARTVIEIASPVLEKTVHAMRPQEQGLIEWDAHAVVEDMVREYAQAVWRDACTNLQGINYPPPLEALLPLCGLKYWRKVPVVEQSQENAQ